MMQTCLTSHCLSLYLKLSPGLHISSFLISICCRALTCRSKFRAKIKLPELDHTCGHLHRLAVTNTHIPKRTEACKIQPLFLPSRCFFPQIKQLFSASQPCVLIFSAPSHTHTQQWPNVTWRRVQVQVG